MKSNGQTLDSLQVKVGTIAGFATKGYQPLWSTANQFGVISDKKSDASSYIKIQNNHYLSKANPGDSLNRRRLAFSYGASVFNNQHFKELFFEQAYAKVSYGALQLRGGRYEERTGESDPELSSGSMGISGNSLPIPKISIAFPQYTALPFTNGWVQFKGLIGHGWFNDNRYMKNALYHEKNLYVRIGKNNLKVSGGIQHFAEWGGKRGNLQLNRSWSGFKNVFFVQEADDGSVNSATILPNRPGDHRGVLEGGIDWSNRQVDLHFYYQVPFESGMGIDIRNRDNLSGLTIKFKEQKAVVKKIVVEFIYTKQMESFGKESQSYYDNGAYKTGWEYNSRIIGTPLFINRTQASHYFSNIRPYNWDAPNNSIISNSNIVSNRLIGGHIGTIYRILGTSVTGKTLATFTSNIGSYYYDNLFKPARNQFYGLQEFRYSSGQSGWSGLVRIGFDAGDLSKNVAFSVGLEKSFRFSSRTK